MLLHIAKVSEVLWSGSADALCVSGREGNMTVLSGHEPLVTTLRKGVLVVKKGEKEVFSTPCEKGILEVTGERITVLL
jgi:F-type H+-transporting ATPase subunit epsilon